jgi:uncharacterized protein (TIGR01777 family)
VRAFVTGATGFVGQQLVRSLLARGDQVVALVRDVDRARKVLGAVRFAEGSPANPERYFEALKGCQAVFHLAGEPLLGRRWSAEHKRAILDSRVDGTRGLVEAIRQSGERPILLSASAVGYYGARGEEPLDESAAPGDDFLARVCAAWEAEAVKAEGLTRCVRVRLGVVLGLEGGALQQMLAPYRLFVGGTLGSGRQYVSWIHQSDLIALLLWLLDTDVGGAVNATAPHPVTMRELSHALGRALHRPVVLRLPSLAVRLALGEAAGAVLDGQRVLPRAALAKGFKFHFETVDAALADLVGRGE